MEIAINIIGFIIAIMISIFASSNIVLTLFKQVPFVNKLQKLGVINGGKLYSGYFLRVFLSFAVIVALFFIPLPGVIWGVWVGIFVAVRGLFDSTLKNDMYFDFVKNMQISRAAVDAKKWSIFVDAVEGVDELNKFINQKSDMDVYNAEANFKLNSEQLDRYKNLAKEGNVYREKLTRILSAMRDELLINDSSLWEKIADKYTETAEFETIHLSIQNITNQQQAILAEYARPAGSLLT